MPTFAQHLQGILLATHRRVRTDTAYRLFMDPQALRDAAIAPEMILRDLSTDEAQAARAVWRQTHEALQRPAFSALSDQEIGIAIVEALREIDHLRRSSGSWQAVPGSGLHPTVPERPRVPTPTSSAATTSGAIPSVDPGLLREVSVRFALAQRRVTLGTSDSKTTAVLLGQLLQRGSLEIQLPAKVDATSVTVRVKLPSQWGISLVDGRVERKSPTRGVLHVELSQEVRRHFSRVLIQARRPTLQTTGVVRQDLGGAPPPVETPDPRDISGLFDDFDRGASTKVTRRKSDAESPRPARVTAPHKRVPDPNDSWFAPDIELLETRTGAWTELPALVAELGSGHAHWVIDVEAERRWTLYGQRGKVVDLVTDPPDMGLDLLRLLTAKGWLNRDMADQARRKAQHDDECVARVLIDEGWLSEAKAERAEHARLKLALQQFGLLRFDRYHFSALSDSPRRPVAAVRVAAPPIRAAIETHQGLPVRRIQRLLRPKWPMAPRLSPRRREALTLTDTEKKVAELMDGQRSLLAIENMHVAKDTVVRALVLGLDSLGLLEWIEMDRDLARVSQLLPQLQARYTVLTSADPFDGLEVHWSAHFDGIRQQARHLKRDLELEFILERGEPAAQALARKTSEAIDGAVAALDTRRKRDAIRSGRVSRTERHVTEEHLIDKGKMLVFRGEFAEARDVFRRVLELNPTHPVAKHQIAQLQGY